MFFDVKYEFVTYFEICKVVWCDFVISPRRCSLLQYGDTNFNINFYIRTIVLVFFSFVPLEQRLLWSNDPMPPALLFLLLILVLRCLVAGILYTTHIWDWQNRFHGTSVPSYSEKLFLPSRSVVNNAFTVPSRRDKKKYRPVPS